MHTVTGSTIGCTPLATPLIAIVSEGVGGGGGSQAPWELNPPAIGRCQLLSFSMLLEVITNLQSAVTLHSGNGQRNNKPGPQTLFSQTNN